MAVREHSPGSFAVTLAPLRALLEASRRKKDPPTRPAADAAKLGALDASTYKALRALAVNSLAILGAPRTESLIHDEMARQFSRLAASLGKQGDRDAQLRRAIETAIADLAAS
jgi:hypothetical protein